MMSEVITLENSGNREEKYVRWYFTRQERLNHVIVFTKFISKEEWQNLTISFLFNKVVWFTESVGRQTHHVHHSLYMSCHSCCFTCVFWKTNEITHQTKIICRSWGNVCGIVIGICKHWKKGWCFFMNIVTKTLLPWSVEHDKSNPHLFQSSLFGISWSWIEHPPFVSMNWLFILITHFFSILPFSSNT